MINFTCSAYRFGMQHTVNLLKNKLKQHLQISIMSAGISELKMKSFTLNKVSGMLSFFIQSTVYNK